MKAYWSRSFYILLLSVFSVCNAASNVFAEGSIAYLNESTQKMDLAEYIYFYEDVNSNLTLSEVLKLDETQFRKNREPIFVKGFTKSVYWIRIDISDSRASDARIKDWVLKVGFPPINSVDLYDSPDGNLWNVRKLGTSQSFSDRDHKEVDMIFNLSLLAGATSRYYLRVESVTSLLVPLHLFDPTAYMNEQTDTSVVWGIYFGLMGIMLCYNLIIFISVKEKIYFYYVVYLAFTIVTMAELSGHAEKYLWPTPWNFSDVSLTALPCISYFWAALFTREYLQLAQHSKILDFSAKMCGNLSLLLGLISIAAQEPFLQMVAVLCLIIPLVWVAILIFCIAQGTRSAIIFMIAFFFLSIGTFVYSLSLYGILVPRVFNLNAAHLGTAIQVVLLSLGLIDKLNTVTKEKAMSDAKNKAQNQFFASMSHELRTPLNSILGYSEIAKSSSVEESKRVEYIGTIERSGQHLLRLINDILDTSKIEAQKIIINKEQCSLVDIVKNVEDFFIILADKKGISFNIVFDFPLPEKIETDYIRLQQILINICGNAIKFTDEGCVTLTVYPPVSG